MNYVSEETACLPKNEGKQENIMEGKVRREEKLGRREEREKRKEETEMRREEKEGRREEREKRRE